MTALIFKNGEVHKKLSQWKNPAENSKFFEQATTVLWGGYVLDPCAHQWGVHKPILPHYASAPPPFRPFPGCGDTHVHRYAHIGQA